MSLSLNPRNLLRKAQRSFSNFPDLIEEWETNLQDLISDQGLTIYEEKNNIIVEASLPGLKEDEIQVNLNKGILWIKGESKEEEKDKEKHYYRKASRSFSYRVALPEQIDEKQDPQASYNDGILKISFQKAKSAENKKISISKGKK